MGLEDGLTDYGDPEFARYLRRVFALSMGYSHEILDRPVVGIVSTASDFNNCHRAMPELVAATQRGVLAAGGLPMVFPTISLGETFLSPTSMMFRNLMAMDTEEMIRAQPMDSVVLIGGCDKSVPAQLMGAISADRPAMVVPVGPMSTGSYGGERLGACTDCRRYWARYRAGEVDAAALARIQANLATTAGTCPVMGTASTMALVAEVLGFTLPGGATIPAVHASRLRLAEATGRLAVGLAADGRRPSSLVTEASVRNALRMILAVGGSTNAIIHLTAIARRAGIELRLRDLNRLSDATPMIVDLKPSGSGYMSDLDQAGGMPAIVGRLAHLFDLDAPTAWGATLGDAIALIDPAAPQDALLDVSPGDSSRVSGIVALFGSLAPSGALLKRSAASAELFETTGRAVVFRSLEDLSHRIDDPDLDVTETDILVLQNAGPIAAGMPEAGYLPIPEKLGRRGVRDMVRISDARMSGTAFGTVILHVSPEAAAGGPLGLVRDGDLIRLSVRERTLDLVVDEGDLLERSRSTASIRTSAATRPGYATLYREHVLQAPDGCDFDFF